MPFADGWRNGKVGFSSGRSGDHSLRQTAQDLDRSFAAENSVRIDEWWNFLRDLSIDTENSVCDELF